MGVSLTRSRSTTEKKEKEQEGRADVEAVVEDLEFTEKGEHGTKRHLVSTLACLTRSLA